MTAMQSAIETRLEKIVEMEQEARHDAFARRMVEADEFADSLALLDLELGWQLVEIETEVGQ